MQEAEETGLPELPRLSPVEGWLAARDERGRAPGLPPGIRKLSAAEQLLYMDPRTNPLAAEVQSAVRRGRLLIDIPKVKKRRHM